jgi:tetratricopeptide (TPR) repeat protein
MEPVAQKRTTPPAAAEPFSTLRWVGAGILLLVLIAYWPAIGGPFVFDDEYLFFRDPQLLDSTVQRFSPLGRPLMNISFWINAKLFGQDPFSFHLGNVLFHCVNGVLLFLAAAKLLQLAGEEELRRRYGLAAFAAALFLLHPVNTESVAYVSGRSESFSLMFFLGAFCVFLYHRRDGIGWGASLAVIALFGAAFLSKEHAVALPALLLWTDLWFGSEGRRAGVEAVRRNWRLYGPMVVMGLAGVGMVWRLLSTADTAGFGMKDLPWYAYFFTQWRALWVYLRLFLFPVNLNADYYFPISQTPMDHGAIFGLVGLLVLVGAAFVYRKKYPLAFYGLVVFLLLIAPTSSIVPIKDPVAERRLYLPFLGLALAACDFARRWNASRTLQVGVGAGILAVCAGLTYSRAEVWSDPVRLWQDTVQKSPENYRARFQLAMAYYSEDRCEEALPRFAEAAKLKPNDHSLLLDWGLAYDCLDRQDEALEKFRAAVQVENTGHARALIGMVLAKQNKAGAALEELNESVRLDPAYDMAYLYRGNVYRMLGQASNAAADYRKALELKPSNTAAQQALAAVERNGGQ